MRRPLALSPMALRRKPRAYPTTLQLTPPGGFDRGALTLRAARVSGRAKLSRETRSPSPALNMQTCQVRRGTALATAKS